MAMRVLITGVLAGALIVAVAAPASAGVPVAPAPVPGAVTYRRDMHVRSGRHVPIGARRVVHSIALPHLAHNQTLRIRAEIEATKCAPSDHGCGNTHLAPRVRAALVLAKGPNQKGGRRVGSAERRCTTGRHHCPLVLSRVLRVPRKSRRASHLNLVVGSRAVRAKPGDTIEIKASKSGKGGGQLTVLRAGAGHRVATVAHTGTRQVGSIPIQTGAGNPPPKKVVVHSLRVDNLRAGEILDVTGALKVGMDQRVNKHGVPALIASQVFLADSPSTTDARTVPGWQRVAPNTGFNCPWRCAAHEVGAIRIAGPVKPTMFVNYVAQSSRTTKAVSKACKGKCRAKVRPGGGLTVRRFHPG